MPANREDPLQGPDSEQRVSDALRSAVRFLTAAQLPDGSFNAYTSFLVDMDDEGTADPSVFPTALIGQCLAGVDDAEALRAGVAAYLLGERSAAGLWHHWPRSHPAFKATPADMDDTCCASRVLSQAGLGEGACAELLLANRDGKGRFLTWFVPGWRWRGWQHARATLPRLLHPLLLTLFFRKTSAAPDDVDAGVNANALYYLGAFPGHRAVVDYLMAILRNGTEADADKWYDNRFVLWYLLARALVPLEPQAAPLILARMRGAVPSNGLEHALAVTTRSRCGQPAGPADLAALLDTQRADGSWRRAAVYFGGRERIADGRLAPAHPDTPRWGSEELTTAFAIEALSCVLRQRRSECP
ncbi:hypothetical protein [Novosphingobium sp. TH158]|uniref:hypothetical protein n=1 Tax=Novosphingobium sp. TH158 TaxID=2067455 RepID=UPI0011817B1C|nr:hypothetical protein [Novosphingobium sp. TH158]